ncbi:MAG: YciI family protein [Acidimicrobiales bacterium]
MHYVLLICSDGVPAPETSSVVPREFPRWAAEMNRRGVVEFGRRLQLPDSAATVRVRDGDTLVTDGPFVETKEFIGGFDVLDCADLDEAIEIAAKHPVSWFHAIEIRPFIDGLHVTDEARAFGRGEDRGAPYCLLMCLDGVPAEPAVEESIVSDGNAWAADLDARGMYVFGHALQHKDTATMVRVRDGETLLSDGPFVETKEFVGGLAVVYCSGRDEAIEVAAAHPLAAHHMIEVRPFFRE